MGKPSPEPFTSANDLMLLGKPQPFALLEERDDGVSATLLIRGLDSARDDAFVQKAQCILRALVRHAADQQQAPQNAG